MNERYVDAFVEREELRLELAGCIGIEAGICLYQEGRLFHSEGFDLGLRVLAPFCANLRAQSPVCFRILVASLCGLPSCKPPSIARWSADRSSKVAMRSQRSASASSSLRKASSVAVDAFKRASSARARNSAGRFLFSDVMIATQLGN